MARSSGQANEPTRSEQDVSHESIFGSSEPAGEDVFLSATEETVAMLNSVFGGDPSLFDGGFSLGLFSFG